MDVADADGLRGLLSGQTFDVAVDWIAYRPDDVRRDVELFRDRVRQYVFISSATVYRRPAQLPVRETSPLGNEHWGYAEAKLDCELALRDAAARCGLPVTIVRPSTTYDPSFSPIFGGYTTIERMRRGAPSIVAGDGRSRWVLTHHEDFARGFVGLLGNERAVGEAFHVTSDEVLTWNEIHRSLAAAAGGEARLVYLPVETIAGLDADWGARLLGDKAHSMVFDNTKLRSVVPDFEARVPFERGAAEIVDWFDADSARRSVDADLDSLMDRLAALGRGE
jgi:nucleoside-diphosphate-sugar epimerase